MQISELAEQVAEYFSCETGSSLTPFSELVLLRHTSPTKLEASLYRPVVCLILQGRKETILGSRTVSFGPGESLIVSHDLPVLSQVTQASPEAPYLAMILRLDLGILHSLYDQVAVPDLETERAQSLDCHGTDADLIDVLGRYLALARKPIEAKVMAPLILREIHFRLLMAPHGGMLRKLLWRGSQASNIARAIAHIRQDFNTPLSVPELAKSIGMSTSSFHKHFKSITAITPLQYQKDLRLIEARRLLSVEGRSVTNAAFEVGYESPTQFSREYARKFGASPRNDLGTMR